MNAAKEAAAVRERAELATQYGPTGMNVGALYGGGSTETMPKPVEEGVTPINVGPTGQNVQETFPAGYTGPAIEEEGNIPGGWTTAQAREAERARHYERVEGMINRMLPIPAPEPLPSTDTSWSGSGWGSGWGGGWGGGGYKAPAPRWWTNLTRWNII